MTSERHQSMFDRIFEEPTRSDAKRSEIETLLKALGADISEGRGSRVRIVLRDVRAVFHRPHPCPDTGKAALRSVKRLLTEAGFTPEE